MNIRAPKAKLWPIARYSALCWAVVFTVIALVGLMLGGRVEWVNF